MKKALDLEQLERDLQQAGSPWEMDPQTSMAQLNEAERERRLGATPPPGEMSLQDAVAADSQAATVTPDMIANERSATAPAKFDHRNVGGKDFTTPVKDQGGCGSCVAHGVCAVMETTYRRSVNNDQFPLDLSEAHLFFCHGGEEGRTCANGWWPDKAFEKARAKGVTLESVYPYSGTQQACAVPGTWESEFARISSQKKLVGRANIKEHIATRGSVTGCFVVYQDFFAYRAGVYRHVSGDDRGGHCVEIVGYDDSQGCWICKNSWGQNWGEGGFFRIAYGQCQIETWSGPIAAEGVTVRLWNRNLKVTGLWSNGQARNAWAHLQGVGWRKLTTTSDAVQHAMLAELVTAKSARRNVSALMDNNQITEVYVV